MVLLDAQTGIQHDLTTQGQYVFTAATTDLPTRFSLRIGLGSATRPSALAALVQLFPNPTRGRFTLGPPAELGASPVEAVLFNTVGQEVARRTLPASPSGASTTFDVTGLAAGLYTLRLVAGPATVVKRVVVE